MMHRWSKVVGVCALAFVVVLLGVAVFSWRPEIDPLNSSRRPGFAREIVVKGNRLAAIGNCTGCHTTDGGIPYAGGVPVATPFGEIHGTNITPDPETGIGQWTEAAFVRAMREGVSRDGHLLYPAFPYEHYRHTTDTDLGALYAFLMTRDAAHSAPARNRVVMPLRWRPLIAGWNLLFLRGDRPPSDRPAEQARARGDYLIDSLGHCGSCHTPRNALGGEQAVQRLGGAVIDGWYAPPLNANSPSPVAWTVDTMSAYLRRGLAQDHAIAAGPMQTVVASLAEGDEADIAAIATAVVASMGPSSEAREAASRLRAQTPLASASESSDPRMALGAVVYRTACADCHDRGRDVASGGALGLSLAVALYEDEPLSLLRVIREGVIPRDGERGRWMPAYAQSLSDEQLVALAVYLRHVAADSPPWPHLERAVAETRR